MIDQRIKGFCPMCGGALGVSSGNIVCLAPNCPDPAAVMKLLADNERHHVVTLKGGRFNVKHPLRERVNDDLLTCDVHQRLSRARDIPYRDGDYRVLVDDDQLRIESVA